MKSVVVLQAWLLRALSVMAGFGEFDGQGLDLGEHRLLIDFTSSELPEELHEC